MTESPADTSPLARSVLRILKTVANVLICLSVLAQCTFFVLAINGGEHEALYLLSLIAFSIAPGILLAALAFLLHGWRVIRRRGSWPSALIYLSAALLPLMLAWLTETLQAGNRPALTQTGEPQSEQFLAGHEWASVHLPSRPGSCPGSEEFARGCRNNIELRRKAQFAAGQQWAVANRPTRLANCKGPLHFVLGCQSYYADHLQPKKQVDAEEFTGNTTAECRDDINAYYEASTALMEENGYGNKIATVTRRSWIPDLKNCDNYDIKAQARIMGPAGERLSRLSRLVDKMRNNYMPDAAEQTQILQDFSEVGKINDEPFKAQYFKISEEYFARLHGGH